ncbi:MobA/MobL family protein [Paenibacillus tianmuensis]|uniref:MobA/MobL family protein n=1 Tax=Paenibacillus tianmuensis TaxID=624147 RepID=UPI002480BA3E|nr:MobA/MobL family protein [Paenibacillus tianmuensis]
MSIKIINRGKGKSSVAAAGYRSGEKITNEYDRVTHDYTRKGGVVHRSILLPDHAPREYTDRGTLWNAVEKIERNCNSQLYTFVFLMDENDSMSFFILLTQDVELLKHGTICRIVTDKILGMDKYSPEREIYRKFKRGASF